MCYLFSYYAESITNDAVAYLFRAVATITRALQICIYVHLRQGKT